MDTPQNTNEEQEFEHTLDTLSAEAKHIEQASDALETEAKNLESGVVQLERSVDHSGLEIERRINEGSHELRMDIQELEAETEAKDE